MRKFKGQTHAESGPSYRALDGKAEHSNFIDKLSRKRISRVLGLVKGAKPPAGAAKDVAGGAKCFR